MSTQLQNIAFEPIESLVVSQRCCYVQLNSSPVIPSALLIRQRYSYRNATSGSTELARSAGSQTAMSATSVNTTGIATNTIGSRG